MIRSLLKKQKASIFFVYIASAFIPLIFILVGLLSYGDFVSTAFVKNPVLNGFIVFTAIFGVVCIFYRFSFIKREWKQLDNFRANDFLLAAEIKSLNKKWLSTTYLKYLSRLNELKVKASHEIDHAQQEIENLKLTLESRLDLPQFIVGLMIALGLFGTFVGLLETLVKVSDLLSQFSESDITAENADKAITGLISNLKSPLEAMGTAFSASMFGLIFSIALGLMMVSLRGYQVKYIETARKVYDDIVALLTDDLNNHDVMQSGKNIFCEVNHGFYQKLSKKLSEDLQLLTSLSLDNAQTQKKLTEKTSNILSLVQGDQEKISMLMDVTAVLPNVLKRCDYFAVELEKLMRSVVMLQVQNEMQQQQFIYKLHNEMRDLCLSLASSYEKQTNACIDKIFVRAKDVGFALEDRVIPEVSKKIAEACIKSQNEIMDMLNLNISKIIMIMHENTSEK